MAEIAEISGRIAQRERDRALVETLIPGLNAGVEGLIGQIEKTAFELARDAADFRKRIARSPLERLQIAGRLLDMCEADAAELLNREIDPLTFDDVLATIEGLAGKMRELKARAERPKAAE